MNSLLDRWIQTPFSNFVSVCCCERDCQVTSQFSPTIGKSRKFITLLRCSPTQTAFIQIVKLLFKRVNIKKIKPDLTDAFYATVSLWSLADQTALIAPLNQSNGSTVWPASASKRQLSGYCSGALSFLLQTHVRKSAEWWNSGGLVIDPSDLWPWPLHFWMDKRESGLFFVHFLFQCR